MNRKTILATLLLCTTLLLPSLALAKPLISISIATAKEVTETRNGVKTSKLVPTQTASPGEILNYALTYVNKGDESATDAVIDNPVPKGMTYVESSATGSGTEITFSADNGKTFAPAVKLTYEVKLPNGKHEKRVATPENYTHIRWTIREVPAGVSGTLRFQARVK